MDMAPPEIQEKRSAVFDSYAAKYAAKAAAKAATREGSPSSDGLASSINASTLPRPALMNVLRSCGLCPTDEELAEAESDVLGKKARSVTKDQFLEICDNVNSLNKDVHSQEILAAFRTVILDEESCHLLRSESLDKLNQSSTSTNRGATPQKANRPNTEEVFGASVNSDNQGGNSSNSNLNAGAHQQQPHNHGNNNNINGNISSCDSPQSQPQEEKQILTRAEMRIVFNLMTDDEFVAAMDWLDPHNTDQVDMRKVTALLAGGVAPEDEAEVVGSRRSSNAAAVGVPPPTASAERAASDSAPSNSGSAKSAVVEEKSTQKNIPPPASKIEGAKEAPIAAKPHDQKKDAAACCVVM